MDVYSRLQGVLIIMPHERGHNVRYLGTYFAILDSMSEEENQCVKEWIILRHIYMPMSCDILLFV
jgi:hypothetical protein